MRTRQPWTTYALLIIMLAVLAGILIWLIPAAQHLYTTVTSSEITPSSTQVVATPRPTIRAGQLPTKGTNTNQGSNPIQYYLFGLAGVCLIFLIAITVVTGPARRRMKASTRHGSAHQASRDETNQYQANRREDRRRQETGMPPESRLILGSYKGRLLSLSEKQQESNILLTAPVGSGKSSAVIIPNLLRERGSRSLFIPDVKGELLKVTGETVSRYHEIQVFAPMHPARSHKYNPLKFVNSIEDAQDLAAAWVSNTGESKDDFWPNVAKRLLTLVILHLLVAEPNAPFYRVSDMLCRMDYETLKGYLTASPSMDVHQEATSFFSYVEQNERLLGSLMTDIATRFQLMLSPQIREATAGNEIDFDRMADEAIALYLSIPTRGVERCRPLLACFVTQMFACWQRRAEEELDGRLPRRIMAYMDEFANLGHIPGISGYISTMRASGVSMLIAIQSFNQLDDRYGQSIRKNIMANTVTHLLLPGAGLDETEYYSHKIGKATIVTQSQSNTDQYGSMSLFGRRGSAGESESESQRELMTSDELRTMAPGLMLILGSSNAPIIAKTTPYFQDKNLAALAQQSYTFTHNQAPSDYPADPDLEGTIVTETKPEQPGEVKALREEVATTPIGEGEAEIIIPPDEENERARNSLFAAPEDE